MDKEEWAGRVGDVWATEQHRTDRTFEPVDEALVEAAVAAVYGIATPHILDVGCGAGTTSFSLATRLPGATINGIDLSPALSGAAVARAAGLPDHVRSRCRFERADATVWTGETGFDLLVSRHGVMFFDDPVAAFAHLRSLAKAGGRLVFSCFRAPKENAWVAKFAHLMPGGPSDPHAPGPFAFADRDRVAAILAEAGWRDAQATALDFAYVAGAGGDPVADANDFFARIGPVSRAIRELDEAGRERLRAGLDEQVRAHFDGEKVSFPAAAWIWSAQA
ncbi:methyltransferase domain-containing protein [Sphingomonas sp. CGMCC 1.13654]|uniref:Methyltransferase domain-containing protein n=1 Tax=Sphingomonas chungangi TaxID=2683589 RepID=A0A838L8A7_9SPHN|nr:methyltransferase [Sphingomonas chungangi]MBA2935703.1 methyltransferase domain-containing protein [Sphingomonas chungangi]MVW54393.1 methyltransferase domain-containing protein [Sphingomonas chungangi]